MSADGRVRVGIILTSTIVAVAVLAGVVLSMPGPVRQPLPFNHALHIEDVGAACSDCHIYVETGMRATIPNLQVCSDCHEEAIGESADEAWLTEQISSDTPIPWQKLYHVPDHVFFSHRRHTAVAQIECQTCHGPMAERTSPPNRPLVNLSMDFCMSCHRQSGASNDCISCHR